GFDGIRQRKQETRRLMIAEIGAVTHRKGDRDAALPAIGYVESRSQANRHEMQDSEVIVVIPDRAGIDEAVELISSPDPVGQRLIEAKLDRARHTIVAADLSRIEAAAEGGA